VIRILMCLDKTPRPATRRPARASTATNCAPPRRSPCPLPALHGMGRSKITGAPVATSTGSRAHVGNQRVVANDPPRSVTSTLHCRRR